MDVKGIDIEMIFELAKLGAAVAKSVHTHFEDRDIEAALQGVTSLEREIEAAGTNDKELNEIAAGILKERAILKIYPPEEVAPPEEIENPEENAGDGAENSESAEGEADSEEG